MGKARLLSLFSLLFLQIMNVLLGCLVKICTISDLIAERLSIRPFFIVFHPLKGFLNV